MRTAQLGGGCENALSHPTNNNYCGEEVFDNGQKRVAKAKKGVVRLLWPLSAATITAINVKWKLDSGNRNDLGNQIGMADTALSFRIVVHGQTT